MAIYIQINRIEDDSTAAIYEFGPIDSIAGTVLIDKESGNVSLLAIAVDQEKRVSFYLPRIEIVLHRHHAQKCYPERTWYAA
jgi:hypothetical protein